MNFETLLIIIILFTVIMAHFRISMMKVEVDYNKTDCEIEVDHIKRLTNLSEKYNHGKVLFDDIEEEWLNETRFRSNRIDN